LGGGLEFLTERLSLNTLKFAMQFKNDNHSEHNIGEPVRHTSDNTFSVALEDVYKPFNKLTVVPGLSYNLRKSLEAEDYDSKNVIISDFPENKSTAANAQAGFYYDLSPDITMNFNAAHKTRFATMKDRYSYKLGTAIPNPDLKAESAENFELAATIRLFKKLSIRPELYYTKLNNTIQLVSNVQDDLSQMQNTGRSEFRGFDFTLNLYPVENLLYYFTYSYIDQRNLSQPEILFIDVPENKFFSSIEYKFRTRAEWMLSGEYNSRRNNSSDGSRISPGYFVMNSQFVFNFGKYFKTEMGVKNIFDKNYTINEGYPEAGRIFHISAFFTFRI
jgi:iron complex outermembrane receptor protein